MQLQSLAMKKKMAGRKFVGLFGVKVTQLSSASAREIHGLPPILLTIFFQKIILLLHEVLQCHILIAIHDFILF